jgi:hypothetical protein
MAQHNFEFDRETIQKLLDVTSTVENIYNFRKNLQALLELPPHDDPYSHPTPDRMLTPGQKSSAFPLDDAKAGA